MISLELSLGFGIGLSLGLLGGGGSILTVPVLVYLVGQTPQTAVTTSLAIVGTNSLIGAMFHRAQGTLNWRVALIFGSVGMVVSFLSANLSKDLSPYALMVIFALLMLSIGFMLVFRRGGVPERYQVTKPLAVVLGSGAGVGLLTGLLGVGGGFLVVPALVMLVGLPAQVAVGTSLIVIAMNSVAGFIGHVGDSDSFDLVLTLIFVSAGLAGTFAGTKLSGRMPSSKLQRIFAIFVIVLAIFLLFDNFPKIF